MVNQETYSLGTLLQFVPYKMYLNLEPWFVSGKIATNIMDLDPDKRGNAICRYRLDKQYITLIYAEHVVRCIAEIIGFENNKWAVLYLPTLDLFTLGFGDDCFVKVT